MAFPRAPKKPVTGKLKLMIKPKETVVEITDKEPEASSPDYSEQLDFKVPRGFSLEMDVSALISKQQKHAAKALRQIRDKLQACGNCRRKVTTAQIDLAERFLNDACGVFVREASEGVSIVTSQLPNGVITFKFSLGERSLHVLVNTSFVEVGVYDHNSLQSELTSAYPADSITNMISWLVST